MNETSFDPESAINFAKFMAVRYDALEAWTNDKASHYVPSILAFGGVSDGKAYTSDIEYEFEYLTVSEYQKESGITLDSVYDPGGLTDAGMGWGGDVAEVAGDAIEWVPLVGSWAGEATGVNPKTADWIAYYQARGVGGEVGTLIQPESGQDPAPWAEPLHGDWEKAIDNRTREVDDVRTEISVMLEYLDSAAKDYMATDLENAAEIDLADYDGK